MRKIFQRGFIWMVTPWFRLQIQNLEWRLIAQKLGLGPRSIRACFWKVPITFRPEVKYSNQNLSAGPSELTSPVCFVTDKQNKTIEISIALSLEWKQQLSGPSEFRELAPTCEYQTIETCLRRLLGQERLCSMSMNQDELFSKTENLAGVTNVFSSALLNRIPLPYSFAMPKGVWGAYNSEQVFLSSIFKAVVCFALHIYV